MANKVRKAARVKVQPAMDRLRDFVRAQGLALKVEIAHMWKSRKGRERAMLWIDGCPFLALEEDYK